MKFGNISKSIALALTFVAVSGISRMPAEAQNNRDQFVRLQTTKGNIVIRVFFSIVPYTAGNFLDLVDSGFYNGLTWHRVENWVIQGGDPNGNGSGQATDPNTGAPKFLRLETNANLNHNSPGMVAMARGNDLNSASCQFYILKAAMPQLNGKYAVFGRVVDGMNAVYAIRPGDRILNAEIIQPNSGGGGNQGGGGTSSSGSNTVDSGEAPVDRKGKPKDSGF